ncbi:hypothetical protein F5887DRAFT_982477 [Amanita rubescens]|nr:hypothetical protein F5887DRAFT_992869 [Amanita rubescens]KAF8338698.1 hypothetical protein F5887DRAFT_982477 [Amanita rubescens]
MASVCIASCVLSGSAICDTLDWECQSSVLNRWSRLRHDDTSSLHSTAFSAPIYYRTMIRDHSTRQTNQNQSTRLEVGAYVQSTKRILSYPQQEIWDGF